MVCRMRFRTIALALALSCGMIPVADAASKPAIKHVKPKYKAPKRAKFKTQKFKPGKRPKYKH